jgi:hypothetical protein
MKWIKLVVITSITSAGVFGAYAAGRDAGAPAAGGRPPRSLEARVTELEKRVEMLQSALTRLSEQVPKLGAQPAVR